MGPLMVLFVLGWSFGLWALFIWAAGSIAQAKGRRFGNWAWLAVLYGVLAVVAVALMPSISQPKFDEQTGLRLT